MRKKTLSEADDYLARKNRCRNWTKVVGALACVVAFCTVYALIMPAAAMENTNCGLEEHIHTDECYAPAALTDTKTLVCEIPEQEGHVHTEECYASDETEEVSVSHEHTEECYAEERGELICGQEESEGHTHDESCYTETEVLICEQEKSEGHSHDEECYDEEGNLICEQEESEGHVHNEDCYKTETELTCGQEESEGHTHSDDCYEKEQVLICGEEETGEADETGETDEADETEPKLICGKEEVTPHTHTEECYETQEASEDQKTLICEIPEHTHTEECLAPAELTEEEQAQVDEVIALIDALPTQEEIEETLTAFEDDGDEDGYDDYLTKIIAQAKAAYEAYSALTEAQREKVTNAAKLMALEPLWSMQTLEPSGDGDSVAGENGFFVSALSIKNTKTGTTTYWDKDDTAGNDSSASNDIIRTFDTIEYTFDTSINNEEGNTGDKVTLWLEITLEKDMTEAMFDPDYFKDLDGYTITYYDKDEKEVDVGTNGLPDYSANTNASGSNDDNPYRTEVVKQVLSGWMEVSRDNAASSFTQTMKAGISVKAARNGDKIQPHFLCWTEGQDKEDGKTADSREITVSAAANYNVRLDRSTTLAYESSFDMDAGTEATENTSEENKVDGIMLAYCVTFQLYNNGDEHKGLMGIELPRGEISADIRFEEKPYSTNDGLDFSRNFTPILWDYRTDGNATNESIKQGAWGRNLYWGGIENTAKAHWAAPGNERGSTYGSCYYGGVWSMDAGYKDSWKNGSGTASGPYTMTVSGYDFDLDNFIFPDRTQGTTSVVYTDNIGCFSAGYLEVLLQYNDEEIDRLPNSTSIYMSTTVGSFKATSMSSETVNNVTEEMKETDNMVNAAITVKNPGSIDKVNSIASKAVTRDIASYYMGIAGTYWTGECGDPATFAGSEVWLAGQFYLSSNAGVMITAFNYLQVFDSAGFSIAGLPQVATRGNITIPDSATTTFLYAADPDYPGGYDSNASEAYTDNNGGRVASAAYMYKVCESDLIYFDSLANLEKAGYTCVGVMLEARGVEMKAYGWSGLTVPVKIADEADVIGKTICTINRVTAWTDDKAAGLTWGKAATASDAKENAEKVTSSVVYKNPQYRLDTQDVVNATGAKSKYDYKKTEYQNGSIATGTHLNGKYGGMSILILGYKASLDLDTVDGKDHYSLGRNERRADYVISNIRTELEKGNDYILDSGTPMTTDLTITVTLDQGLTLDFTTLEMGEEQILNDTYKDTDDAKREYIYTDNEGKEQTITYTVYYTYDAASQRVTVQIRGVPVGIELDNITFSAAIGEIGSDNDVTDGSELTVEAKITGAADRRAYSEAAGNLRTKTIGVSNLTGTSLVKTVDQSYIELDGSFTYTLKYTNGGSETMTNALYLYDIMPVSGDSRGSSYTDASDNKQVGITKISARVTGGSGGSTSAMMRVYYSMVPGTILNQIIDFRGFPENDKDGLCLRQLLGNALVDQDGNIYFFQTVDGNGDYKNVDLYTYSSTGTITARNFELDKDSDDNNLYTVNKLNVSYSRFAKVKGFEYVDGKLVIKTEDAAFKTNTYTKLFRYLGDIKPGSDGITDSAGSQSVSDFTHATCIFAAAVNLGAGETIHFEIGVRPEGNKAADLYGNTAHSWISDTPPAGELDSNMVTTRAVSRTISGKVWYDANLNGIRDVGETPISEVTCTLFKWDTEANKYVQCAADVTGAEIKPVKTVADGAYSFEKLAAGDYIVAFSGDVLDKYTGATSYQKNGTNDSNTNDGIALFETKSDLGKRGFSLSGISSDTYKYAIAYKLSGSGGNSTVEKLALHSICDANGNLQITQYLNGYTEQYSDQDLGLIIAGYELPLTGGSGTTPYTIGGLLLLTGAGLLLAYRGKKHGKEDAASS